MNSGYFIARLESNAGVLAGLMLGVEREQALWKPAPDKWSILEVAGHLLDEEREDFRVRLDLLLHKPGEAWPGIDPQGWVVQRAYAQKDLEATVRAFLEERRRSISWLKGLKDPAWQRAYEHPLLGAITAGDLLASWAGHDLLHVRQLARLHFEQSRDAAHPHSTAYAGSW